MRTKDQPERFPIVIVGTGFSGIAMGVILKQAGIDSVTILEQADAIGGTWRASPLVRGNGARSIPPLPNIPVLEELARKIFRSSRRDHRYDLAPTPVAGMSTGARAGHFVPQTARKV